MDILPTSDIKTGQELTIRIETRLQNIINQYEKKTHHICSRY